MAFLALDTSGDSAVLALAEDRDGRLLATHAFQGRRTLSRRLMSEIDGLLRGEGMTLSDVSALAVGLGPGSFTGVRVGVTTARTLAQVLDKPLVGVGTLDAYAAPWGWTVPTLVVLLPSRRGEVYAAIFRGQEADAEPFAELVEAMERRLQALDDQGSVVCCGAVHLLTQRPRVSLAQVHVPPDGLALAAVSRLKHGHLSDPLSLAPLYVVPPSISTPKNAAILPTQEGIAG